MSKCTFLVGPPGVGKSTYVDHHGCYVDCYVLSTDNIITQIALAYDMTYDETFKDLIGFAEKVFYRNMQRAIDEGSDILIDRTNLTVKGRKKIIDMLKPHGYTFEAVVFSIPERSEWDRRLASRKGKFISRMIIDNMMENYVEPSVEEGFTLIKYM